MSFPPIYPPSFFDPQTQDSRPHHGGSSGDVHGVYSAVSTTGITHVNTGIGGVFVDSIFSAFAPQPSDQILAGGGGGNGNGGAPGGVKGQPGGDRQNVIGGPGSIGVYPPSSSRPNQQNIYNSNSCK